MTREEIGGLLPFLANGTLEGAERKAVEDAVAADPALQDELAALRAIRDTVQREEVASPGELGLARLMREIEPPKAANSPHAPSRFWQVATVVLFAVVLGQVAFNRDADFATAPDSGDGFSLAGAAAPVFTIAFRPGTDELAMRDLLLDAGVEVTSGPSALGLYGLSPVEGVTNAQAQAILSASDIVDSLDIAGD